MDKYLEEERLELEKVISQKRYWWYELVNDAFLCTSIKGQLVNIKLPLPVTYANKKWLGGRKYKKHDEAEIARCKSIWIGLTESIQEKIWRIEAGEITVEEAFKDGIFFEDGKYGLKIGGSWI